MCVCVRKCVMYVRMYVCRLQINIYKVGDFGGGGSGTSCCLSHFRMQEKKRKKIVIIKLLENGRPSRRLGVLLGNFTAQWTPTPSTTMVCSSHCCSCYCCCCCWQRRRQLWKSSSRCCCCCCHMAYSCHWLTWTAPHWCPWMS